MPEFAQIDHTDAPDNFIHGFEQFTKQIESYMETKDEQMQCLIQSRRTQYKSGFHSRQSTVVFPIKPHNIG